MKIVLVFGVLLLAGVLVSERARRTVLSTSVLFLVAGVALGRDAVGWIDVSVTDPVVAHFAELALFSILFVDGADMHVRDVVRAWHLPGRALILGMPLTIAGVALAARVALGVDWLDAFLLGAILSPTDPVFAAAILAHEAVPLRLRRLLSVESGLNDGLALPVVLVLLAVESHAPVRAVVVVGQLCAGTAIGVAVPWVFARLEKLPVFGASAAYRPLAGLGVAMTVYALTTLAKANAFLGAFAAGITFASMLPRSASAFQSVGAPIAELYKLAALLIFGASVGPGVVRDLGWRGLVFVVLALLAVRPAALLLSLLGGGLSRREWAAAAWFGPKGFASILYALLMLEADVTNASRLFDAVALVTVISIIAHSSTDVLVARLFKAPERRAPAT